jgi:hypothetical protein
VTVDWSLVNGTPESVHRGGAEIAEKEGILEEDFFVAIRKCDVLYFE